MLSREGLIGYYHQRGKWLNLALTILKKKLFRWLTEVTIRHPEEIVKTIVSECILHNLCIVHYDSVEDYGNKQ